MSNPLTDLETEAISLLQAGNPQAFSIVLGYFKRMHAFESQKCVDTEKEKVPVHQGRARAFRDAMNIHVDATNRLSSQ